MKLEVCHGLTSDKRAGLLRLGLAPLSQTDVREGVEDTPGVLVRYIVPARVECESYPVMCDLCAILRPSHSHSQRLQQRRHVHGDGGLPAIGKSTDGAAKI